MFCMPGVEGVFEAQGNASYDFASIDGQYSDSRPAQIELHYGPDEMDEAGR